MADQNSTELKIIARLVDQASAPLAQLGASIAKFGAGGANLSGITASVSDLSHELALTGDNAKTGLGAVEITAKRASDALAVLEKEAGAAKAAVEQVSGSSVSTPTVGSTSIEETLAAAKAAQQQADELFARINDAQVSGLDKERAAIEANIVAIDEKISALEREGAQVDKVRASAVQFRDALRSRVDTASTQQALELETRVATLEAGRLVKLRELAKVRGDTVAVAQLDRQIAEQHGKVIDGNTQRQIAAIREQFRGRADLSGSIDRAERALKSQAATEKDILRTVRERVTASREVSAGRAASGLGQLGSLFTNNLGPAGRAFGQLGSEVVNLGGGLDNLALKAGISSRALIGIGLAGAGIAGVGAILGSAAEQAGKLEKSLEGVQILSGVSATDIERLKDKAVDFANETGIALDEILKGFAAAGQSGVRKNVDDFVRVAVQGALVGLGAVDQAVARLKGTLDGFQLTDTDAPRVLNVLVAGADVATTSAAKFADALASVSQEARALDIPLEQTAGALAAIIKQGVEPVQAASGLSTLLQRLSRDADPAVQKLRALGVEVGASEIKTKGLVRVAGEIAKALDPANPVVQRFGLNVDALRADIFGTGKAAQAAFVVFTNGAQEASNAVDALSTNITAADAAQAKVLNNTSRRIDQIQEKAGNFFVRFGQRFNELVAGLTSDPVQIPMQLDVAAIQRDKARIEALLKDGKLSEAANEAIKLQAASTIKEIPGSEKAAVAFEVLNGILAKTNGQIVNIDGNLKKLTGFTQTPTVITLSTKFEDVKVTPILEDIEAEAAEQGGVRIPTALVAPRKDQIGRAITDALDALPKQFLELDAQVTPKSVLDAIEFLKSKIGEGQVLISPEEQQRIQAALETVRQATSAQTGLEQLLTQAQSRVLDGIERQRAENAAIEKQLEDQIALYEKQGASIDKLAAARAALVQVRAANAKAVDDGLIDDFKKLIADAGKHQADVRKAANDAARAVDSTIAGLGRSLLTPFEAERKALQETIDAAMARVVETFSKASTFDPVALIAAIGRITAAANQLRSRLDQKQAAEFLDNSVDTLQRIKTANLDLLDGTTNALGRIQLGLEAERIELEKLQKSGALSPDQAFDAKQVQDRLALLKTQDFFVDVSFRPAASFDEEAFRRTIAERIRPEAEQARVLIEQILAGQAKGEDTSDLERQLEGVSRRVREMRLELEQADGRFAQGFGDGLSASIDDLNDKFKNGQELARDYVGALTDNFSDLIEKIALGKASFKDFANSLIADLIRITSRSLAQDILGGILGGLGGGGSGGFVKSAGIFANGGIVEGQLTNLSGISALPLHKYAMGGIANSPQIAMIAERPGMAEAFVPLPDGKRIPVALNDSRGGSGGGHTIHITINANAIDAQGMDQVLQERARTIGDIVAGQIASGENRSLRTTTRGRR